MRACDIDRCRCTAALHLRRHCAKSGMRDRGQATMLLLAAIVFISLAAVGVGEMGRTMSARQRAQTAADAAALAGANGDEVDARRVATRNGAAIVGYHRSGETVTVVVVVDHQRATARASRAP